MSRRCESRREPDCPMCGTMGPFKARPRCRGRGYVAMPGGGNRCVNDAEWLYRGLQLPGERERLTLYLCDVHARHHTPERPVTVKGEQMLPRKPLEGKDAGLYLEPLSRAKEVAA